jgi:hypothetical protein
MTRVEGTGATELRERFPGRCVVGTADLDEAPSDKPDETQPYGTYLAFMPILSCCTERNIYPTTGQ